MMDSTTPPLGVRRSLAYAAPALALAIVGVPLYVYIPKFYTDTVGVAVGAVGLIVLLVRLFDAVTDPLFGYLSDHTRTRFGRRRPYMAIGSLFLGALIVMIYVPPELGTVGATVWFAVALAGLSVAWTAVSVPWESLGPEITDSYHARTALFGLREGMTLFGILLAVASPPAIGWLILQAGGENTDTARFAGFAAVYAPLTVLLAWVTILAIRERPRAVTVSDHSPAVVLRGFRDLFRNRPFVILILAYAVSALGSNLPATLILYYVEYVLGSQRAELFLLLYIATGVLFLPAWVLLGRHYSKKTAWIAAMAVNTGAFVGVFFLGRGDELLYGMLTVLSGIGFGGVLALPVAMQADVIDYDEYRTGERREGQYIGLWAVTRKATSALGMGIGLSVLGLVGYTPNTEQEPIVVDTLRVLYALVPSACNAIALVIALRYPISPAAHRSILEAIRRRSAGENVPDPLARPV
jgi:GPH family glycoside/pentoside/hexuronide:cation symporter